MTYDAIIPAGGKISPEFAAQVGTSSKALIELNGKTVLERTLAALQASGVVNKTVVIGSEEVLAHPASQLASIRLPEGATGPDNIFRGLEELAKGENPPKRVIVVTSDLPFLTPELIHQFISMCPEDRDFCVPLVDQKSFEARFPGTKAMFVALKDNVWTTGCMYMIDVAALHRARPYIERVFENRKSKMGMARLLGPVFVFKWLTKQLTVADIEKKITGLLRCSGKAVMNSPAELTYDIDYPEDYEYAAQHADEYLKGA